MNSFELYNKIDDSIKDYISDYREHKSHFILESDIQSILSSYKSNGYIKTFFLNFFKNTFEILIFIELQLDNDNNKQQLIPLEFRYELNSEDDTVVSYKQSMYEKLEKMLDKLKIQENEKDGRKKEII